MKTYPAPQGQQEFISLCFDNTSDAVAKLGNSANGHATFEIENLQLNYLESEVYSTAKLDSVSDKK